MYIKVGCADSSMCLVESTSGNMPLGQDPDGWMHMQTPVTPASPQYRCFQISGRITFVVHWHYDLNVEASTL